ncbi:MAG: hypothetical protein P4L84_20875 [Isosphaeraceae bacterium]|nr:hypothetical protein [Isosphaeraceae bacterium]
MNDSLPDVVLLVPVEAASEPWPADQAGEAPSAPVPVPAEQPPRNNLVRRIASAISSASEWLFGAFALVLGLSILSAMPVLQFLVFGYLLEAGGRVARTGRLRDGFVGCRKAARVGRMVIGCTLMMLPLWFGSSMAADAAIVDPGGSVARGWRLGLVVLTVLLFTHMAIACARGGKIRYFLWPFPNPFWLARRVRQGGAYAAARDGTWEFVAGLRFPYYFRLGLLGFLGTMAWLVVPVSLLAAGRRLPVLGFLGALLLAVVAPSLLFIQTRFAVENRFRALFEFRAIRQCFRRAPWAYAFAFVISAVFAVPLYLLKIEMIPREVAWLPALVFLGFIFPARLLAGWAYSRSQRRAQSRHWFVRWTGRLIVIPIAVAYVFIVFMTQFTAWQGFWSLYEQHAFLLPVPFVNL